MLYLIRNKINGKLYIGQTNRTLSRRWEEHLRDARRYTHYPLYRAMKKYGVENFEIESLCPTFTQREADILEKGLIRLRRCKTPNGYNQTDGGKTGAEGFKMREESKAKLRAHRLGKTATAETKRKISEVQRGSKNHNFGKALTDNHRAKISHSLAHPRAKLAYEQALMRVRNQPSNGKNVVRSGVDDGRHLLGHELK